MEGFCGSVVGSLLIVFKSPAAEAGVALTKPTGGNYRGVTNTARRAVFLHRAAAYFLGSPLNSIARAMRFDASVL